MKRHAVLFVLLLLSIGTFAQKLTIKGVVKEETTKNAIPFCNIVVVQDTLNLTKNIGGTQSMDDGSFSVTIKGTKGYIVFSSVGYGRKVVKISVDAKKEQTFDAGEILLTPKAEELLSDVVVEAKQKRFEMHNDKMVMNVDDAITTSASNAFEMLRKVPGVVIDKDENIQLNGNSGVLFQFDGRDMRLPYEAMKAILKGIPPTSIEKIEVINNPSSKYEAEGTAGIINIVMAQQQSSGWGGDAHAWVGYDEVLKHNEGVNLSYVDKKWTISSGLGFNNWAGKSETSSDVYIWNMMGDTTLQKMANQTNKFSFQGLDLNLSADYKINDNNSIGAMITYDRNWQPEMNDPLTRITFSPSPYNIIDSSYSVLNNTHSRGHNVAANLYYNHKFDTLGGQYSIAFDFDNNKSHSYFDNETEYFLGNFASSTRGEYNNNKTNNEYNTYSLKFDVVKPFNDKMSLEFGAKSRWTSVNNDFDCYENGAYSVARSNNLGYNENVNALYVSFSDKLSNKLSFRAGLRGEHTYTKIKQEVGSAEHTNNYFDVFPNLNLSYKINQLDNLSLTYSYRITRPDYNSMNPFEQKSSDYSYMSGNPDLKPQYSHNINLNYAFHYMIFLTGSYSYTNDLINQVAMVRPGTLIVDNKPYNLGYSQNASLGLSTALPLPKGILWTIWMQGTYGQTKVDDANLKVDVDRWGFMTWQSLSIDFFFKTKLSLSGFYMTGGNMGLVEWGDMYSLSMDLSKEFLQKRMKASVGVSNLPKHSSKIKTYSNLMRVNMTNTWQYPMITFSLNYNIGKKADNNTLKKIQTDDMDSRSAGGNSMGGQQGQQQVR